MPIIATLDRASRYWLGQEIAEVTAVVTETSGAALPADQLLIGLGGYYDEPGAWLDPSNARQVSSSSASVSLLIGDEIQPVGLVWIWVQWPHSDERELAVCLNKRLDFTGTDWDPPIPPDPEPVTAYPSASRYPSSSSYPKAA